MPSRRSLLGSLGVLLTAGCSQQSQADSQAPADTSTTTRTTTTTSDTIHAPTRLEWGASTTYDGSTVTATSTWSQHSVITLTTPDSFGARRFDGNQLLFVVIDVDGDDPVPQPGDFAIDVGGERYPGWTSYEGLHTYRFRLGASNTAYDPEGPTEGGWVGFALPEQLEANGATLRLQFAGETEGATHWPLPAEVRDGLRAPPPEFHLESVETPDSLGASEPAEVTLTASNQGEGSGTFRAAVNEAGPQYMGHAVRVQIPPGERRTASVTIVGPQGTDASSTTVRIVTPDRTVSRTISVE